MSSTALLQPQAIRALRRSLGLTQAAFGDLLGVTNVTISRWESGAFEPDNRAMAALEAMVGVADQEPSERPLREPGVDFAANPDAVAAVAEAARLSFGHLAS